MFDKPTIMKKQALITGATSGILGHATALRLAALGYDIIATGRRAERLAALKSAIEAQGGSCRTLCFDVRSEAECRKHLEPLDRVDLLLNNAGLAAGLEHIDQGSTADWDAMIDTNVKGLLYVTRIITPKMIAAGGGHVINIGSIAGTEPYENGAVYCASKHAVHAISQALSVACRPAEPPHQGHGDPSGHGRNRIFAGAFPRRSRASRQDLYRRRTFDRRGYCGNDRLDRTITGPHER